MQIGRRGCFPRRPENAKSASAAGGPFWVAWVVSLKPPAPPREALPPKATQRHSKETVWVVWSCLLEFSEPPLGGLGAPKGTLKALQGRGQYEASDLKLTQTKASELKLHSSFPQGHWSSRAEAELAKRKQLIPKPTDGHKNRTLSKASKSTHSGALT